MFSQDAYKTKKPLVFIASIMGLTKYSLTFSGFFAIIKQEGVPYNAEKDRQ
jgi:hypothetical protein